MDETDFRIWITKYRVSFSTNLFQKLTLYFLFSFNKIIQKFTEFIDYCRALAYEETPDYEHLRNMLRNRMKLKNYEFDKNFDWIENDPFQQVQGWQMYKNGDSVNNGEDHGD